jgi:hypothetical protein
MTLYVVRHDKTPKVFIKMINDLNSEKKFKKMALVFNGLKKRGVSFGSFNRGMAMAMVMDTGMDMELDMVTQLMMRNRTVMRRIKRFWQKFKTNVQE